MEIAAATSTAPKKDLLGGNVGKTTTFSHETGKARRDYQSMIGMGNLVSGKYWKVVKLQYCLPFATSRSVDRALASTTGTHKHKKAG